MDGILKRKGHISQPATSGLKNRNRDEMQGSILSRSLLNSPLGSTEQGCRTAFLE